MVWRHDSGGASVGDRTSAVHRDGVPAMVARAQGGEADAFACLTGRYQAQLDHFCARLMPSAGQDLAQETLFRAYASIGTLRDPATFPAWLFGIAANLARWWWRRQARWPVSLERLAAEYPDVPWKTMISATPLPEAALEEAEQRRRLVDAVGSLPPSLGQALALHYLDGLSYAEVAAALQVPVTTVKGRLFKSRAMLRQRLAEVAGEEASGADGRRRAVSPRGTSARKDDIAMAEATNGFVRVVVEDVRGAAEEPAAEALERTLRTWPRRGETSRVAGTERRYDYPLTVDREHWERPGATALGGAAQPELVLVAERLTPEIQSAGLLVPVADTTFVLREEGGDRRLAIRVGAAEGLAMAVQQQGITPGRPLTYDFVVSLLKQQHAFVERVAVTRLDGNTFYATVTVHSADGSLAELDSRPSDAINLALRTGAPIFAAATLLKAPGEEGEVTTR